MNCQSFCSRCCFWVFGGIHSSEDRWVDERTHEQFVILVIINLSVFGNIIGIMIIIEVANICYMFTLCQTPYTT